MSRTFIQNLLTSLVMITACVLATHTVAKADSVQLTTSNDVTATGPGPFADVNYVLNGDVIDVTVSGIGNYSLFGSSGTMFGFNVVGSTAGLNITNLVNCTVGGTDQQISAFGRFEFTVGGTTPPGVTSFAFSVTRTGGFSSASQLFENNADGFAFAAHIYNPDGPVDQRSGFAGNGTSNVPEPASIFLLGSGMIGIASGLRKRLKKNSN